MTFDNTDTANANILLLDTRQSEQRSLSVTLEQSLYHITETSSLKHAFSVLRDSEIHVFLLFNHDDQTTTLNIIRQVRYLSPHTEIIVVSSLDNDDIVSQTYAAGVFDYLISPVSARQLLGKIQKAVEYRSLQSERDYLRQQAAMNFSYDSIIGISKPMAAIKKTISSIAPTDIPVLITGDTGTGKSFLARVIHYHSKHRHQKLVTLDCSVLPDRSFEQQLFSADTKTGGRSANDNIESDCTLVLENVQCLPLTTQDRLLDFLKNIPQDNKGQSRNKTNRRIITTADGDLSLLVNEGKFRRDLYDRLGVIVLNLPALRERQQDFELLTEHLLRKIAVEHHRETLTINSSALVQLQNYHWPENVRELEETLRRAAVLQTDGCINVDHILMVNDAFPRLAKTGHRLVTGISHTRLDESQRDLIENALNENDWNFTRTAHELGIGRTTLWRKVKKYNLKRTMSATK